MSKFWLNCLGRYNRLPAWQCRPMHNPGLNLPPYTPPHDKRRCWRELHSNCWGQWCLSTEDVTGCLRQTLAFRWRLHAGVGSHRDQLQTTTGCEVCHVELSQYLFVFLVGFSFLVYSLWLTLRKLSAWINGIGRLCIRVACSIWSVFPTV